MDSGQLKIDPALLEAVRWGPEDALAGYARDWPDLAKALVGGRSIGDGSAFRRDLFIYFDGFLRSQVTGDELASTCRAMRAILEHSSASQFKLAMAADARTATRERLATGELNTLWGVTPIVNLGPMRTAARLLGVTADSFCYQPYFITNDFDIVLAKQYEWALKHEAIAYSWIAFSWAMLRYDVFHYYYDRGILLPFGGYGSPNFGVALEEMQLLKVAGKRLYCLAYGADNRTRARTLASAPINFCMHCTAPGRYCLCDDDKAETMFSVIDQYTTANLASGLSTDYVPNSYEFHYLVVDVREYEPSPVETDPAVPLRILHAPNHAQFKGSHYLMDTIAELRREGVPIELRLITGVPHNEVIAAMREAHVVADQFIGGFYGQTAIEAMALGRPVLCYVREPQKAAAPKELPIINCQPDTIRQTLLDLVAKRKSLATIGARSRKYVEKHHSLLAMAHRLKVLYQATGDLPDTVTLREPGPPLPKPFVLKRLNRSMSDAMLQARAGMREGLAAFVAEMDAGARHSRAAIVETQGLAARAQERRRVAIEAEQLAKAGQAASEQALEDARAKLEQLARETAASVSTETHKAALSAGAEQLANALAALEAARADAAAVELALQQSEATTMQRLAEALTDAEAKQQTHQAFIDAANQERAVATTVLAETQQRLAEEQQRAAAAEALAEQRLAAALADAEAKQQAHQAFIDAANQERAVVTAALAEAQQRTATAEALAEQRRAEALAGAEATHQQHQAFIDAANQEKAVATAALAEAQQRTATAEALAEQRLAEALADAEAKQQTHRAFIDAANQEKAVATAALAEAQQRTAAAETLAEQRRAEALAGAEATHQQHQAFIDAANQEKAVATAALAEAQQRTATAEALAEQRLAEALADAEAKQQTHRAFIDAANQERAVATTVLAETQQRLAEEQQRVAAAEALAEQRLAGALADAEAKQQTHQAFIDAVNQERAVAIATLAETQQRFAGEQLRAAAASQRLAEEQQRTAAAETLAEERLRDITQMETAANQRVAEAQIAAEAARNEAQAGILEAQTRAAEVARESELSAGRDIKRIAEEALIAVRAAQEQAERAVRTAETEARSVKDAAARELLAAQEVRAELRWQDSTLREAQQRSLESERTSLAAQAAAQAQQAAADEAVLAAQAAEARALEREREARAAEARAAEREQAALAAELQALSAGTNLQESEAYLRLEAFAARTEAQMTGQSASAAQASAAMASALARAASEAEAAALRTAELWRQKAEASEAELLQASAAAMQVMAVATGEIADLKTRASRVGAYLRKVQASKAWKLTAPLRGLHAFVRGALGQPTVAPVVSAEERQARAMVATFAATHQRPLRVLHIGNDGNDAYRNAKTQRAWGIDADVLAMDQYGAIDSPEWEDAGLWGQPANLARPDWSAVDTHGFHRPKWFAQGPADPAIRYLLNKGANPAAARRQWRWLKAERWLLNSRSLPSKIARRLVFWRTRRMIGHSNIPANAVLLQYTGQMMTKWGRRLRWLPLLPKRLTRAGERAIREGILAEQSAAAPGPPGSPPGWTHPYLPYLLDRYDVIEAYGQEATIPYLAGRRYIAHEHGRIAPQSEQGVLCTDAYRAAAAVFVTNTDSIAVGRLPVSRDRAVALPRAADTAKLVRYARRTKPHGPGWLTRFVATARQSWVNADAIDGTGADRIIRALALVRASGRECVLFAVAWGEDVEASKALAQSLGVADMIQWRPVQPKPMLWREYVDADAVLGQFATAALSGSAAEAMALGKRVITRLDQQTAAEFYGAPPPVYPAETVEDIARAMMRVIDDPADLARDGAASQSWALAYHSAGRIAALQVKTYAGLGVLASPPALPSGKRLSLLGRVNVRVRNRLKRSVVKFVERTGEGALRRAVPLGRAMTRWRMNRGKMRTVWGVTPILTLPLLAKCDALLGLRSKSLVYVTYYITRNFDINLSRWNTFFLQHGNAYHAFTKWVLAYVLLRYDIVSFFYDRGILAPPNGRIWIAPDELKTLKNAGKRIYTYAYGADVRTRETTLALGTYNYCVDCTTPRKFCICSEEEGTRNMEGIRPYANAMVAMGDMIHYVPGYRNFHYWPIDIDRIPYSGTNWTGQRPLKILHAPNHQHFKGSRHLFAAVDRLKAEGAPIELKTISGVSNAEVLKAMAEADIVAEQFIGGTIGYTAVEGWSMGKPVLTYVRDVSATATWETGKWDDFPGLSMTPDHIYDMLKAILEGRHNLPAIGRASRRYAETHYSLEAVALKLGKLYVETGDLSQRQRKVIERNMRKLSEKLDKRLAAPLPAIA